MNRRRFMKLQGGIGAGVLIGWHTSAALAEDEEEAPQNPSVTYRLKLQSVDPEPDGPTSDSFDSATEGDIKLDIYVSSENVEAPVDATSVSYSYRVGWELKLKNGNAWDLHAAGEYVYSAEAHLVNGGPDVESSVTRNTDEDPSGAPSPDNIPVDINGEDYQLKLDIDASGSGGTNLCFARANLYNPAHPEGEPHFVNLVAEVPLPTPGTSAEVKNYVGITHVFVSEKR